MVAPNSTMRKATTRATRQCRSPVAGRAPAAPAPGSPGAARSVTGAAAWDRARMRRATTAMITVADHVGAHGHLAPLAVEGDAHGEAR